MKKKELLKKKELAEQLGMKFEEASDLFSNETLEIMQMDLIVGGQSGAGTSANLVCPNGLCPNGLCISINACPNEKCPCSTPTQEPPPEINWLDCPIDDFTFPPPPVVAQDALCGAIPPTVTT